MTSLREAINNKCKECIYDSRSKGTWRQQVKDCTSTSCPLYSVRPRPIVQNSPNSGQKTTETNRLKGEAIPTHISSKDIKNSGVFLRKTNHIVSSLFSNNDSSSREEV